MQRQLQLQVVASAAQLAGNQEQQGTCCPQHTLPLRAVYGWRPQHLQLQLACRSHRLYHSQRTPPQQISKQQRQQQQQPLLVVLQGHLMQQRRLQVVVKFTCRVKLTAKAMLLVRTSWLWWRLW